MKKILLLLITLLSATLGFSQSNNCTTATILTLDAAGAACFSGSTEIATSSLTTNDCTPDPVNEVWFSYTVEGPQNTYNLAPGTLEDAVITIYADGCNTGTYDFCQTGTGGDVVDFGYGLTTGDQVWISVASNSLTDGTFDFCVTSTPTDPGEGNTCDEGISTCEKNDGFTVSDMSIFSSSGQSGSCFQGPGSNSNEEMWITFSVSADGTITWEGNPDNNATEYDWSMWDITDGCPGTEVACNYAWNQQNGVRFGMGCGTTDCDPAFNALAGRTYAIQIVNWSNNGTGFNFSGIGGTAAISPNVNFSMTQTDQCNLPVTASFTANGGGDAHVGVVDWTFGNGNTWSGEGAPASQEYDEAGTYAVTASAGTGTCYSTQTEYVYVYEPLAATSSIIDDFCDDTAEGAISVSPTGGDGVYTYAWAPDVSSGPNATGLAAGNYTVTISNAACGDNLVLDFTLVGVICCGVDILFPTTRLCMSDNPILLDASYTGTDGSETIEWSPSDYITDPTNVNATFNPPAPGFYDLTFTVDNSMEPGGCITPRDVRVNVIEVGVLGQTAATSCPGTCDGSVQVTSTSGGNAPYTITWDNGLGNGNFHDNLCAGSYNSTVIEDGGCEGYLELVVDDAVGFVVDAGEHDCNVEYIDPGDCYTLSGFSGVTPTFNCNNTTHEWNGNTAITDPQGPGQGTPVNSTQDINLAGTTEDDFISSVCFTIDHEDHNQLDNIFIQAPDGTAIYYFNDGTFSFASAEGAVTYCFDDNKFDDYEGPINGAWTLNVKDYRKNPNATGNFTNITIVTCEPVFDDLWSPLTYVTGDPKTLNPEICPSETTTYTLTVADENGCEIEDEITVVVGPCSFLPVTLINFSGVYNNRFNELIWSTATETDNEYFILEYSDNGSTWNEVAKIDGAGNSTVERSYFYKHSEFKKDKINYYRLSQYDFDGGFDTFHTVSIDNRITANLIKTVNTLGQVVNSNYKGIVIDYFDDGSMVKRYQH